jgi:BNR repeat-like domain
MKQTAITLMLAGGIALCSATPEDVVKMWKCPMPDPAKVGAGYEPVKGVIHAPVFKATRETGGYNHHAKIIHFKGKYYALWSNQKYAEDAPGQKVLYSTSEDGKKWTTCKNMFPSMHKEAPWGTSGINLSANKWVIQNGRLYARAWCGATIGRTDLHKTKIVQKHSRKYCFAVRKVYSHLYREVLPNGELGPIASFKPQELPKNILVRVVDAKKAYPELKHSKNLIKRTLGKVVKGSKRRLCEATPYQRKDGSHVVLFRDDNYSHRKWVTFSKDGKNWTPAKPTNIPDSPSATTSLTLKDGTVLLIGNHMAPEFDNPKRRHFGRDPLMVSVSKDGLNYTKSYAIRSGKQKYTVPRKVVRGRGGGAQYPDAIIVGDTVLVIYSHGKEDIWVSLFPVLALGIK